MRIQMQLTVSDVQGTTLIFQHSPDDGGMGVTVDPESAKSVKAGDRFMLTLDKLL